MKKITLLFILSFFTNLSFSQGTDILSSEQFCSGTSQLTFNNIFGTSNTTPVGCLGSIPNAAYFYLEIDQPGDLIFTISQEDTGGFPIDVDFIAWGPFIDLNDANTSITFTDCLACPNNTADPSFYPYAPDYITDCSFSFSPTETMNILNAQQGEVYVVLITNYNGNEGIINFHQSSGNGTTTCATIPVCGSQFYDTGGVTGNYSNNESYSTTISPYFSGGTVSVDFTAFNVSAGDVLTVYNGPNTTFPVLGTVTGTQTFTSTTVTNPTGALTFQFTSNGNTNANGWVADITCTAPPTPPTCGFTFYDNGGVGGNYSNNALETTTFYPDTTGDAVTATFTAFDIENCCDALRVYDGPNTTFPLLGVYAGTTTPGPFTSSHATGALTFVFDSDGSVTRNGWAADITCISNCNISITDTIYPIGADECTLDYTELVANSTIPSPSVNVYSESFNNTTFPTGWTIINGATSADWIISNSSNAGGTAREAMLDWVTGSNINTWSLSSPAITITGYSNLQLSFKQNLDIYLGGDLSIYIETSLDGTTWTAQYSVLNVPNDIVGTQNIDISSLDGNTTLFVRFRLTGDSFDLFNWSLDDILVTADGPPTPPQITWSPTAGLFTDSGLTTPYAGGFTDTVYATPNGIQTYTATDSNSCTDMVTVVYNKKIWNGSVNTNWYINNNWSPSGVPTIDNCIVIPDNGTVPNYPRANKAQTPIPLPPQPAQAKSLTLEPNAYLEVETNTELIVQEWVHVQNTGILNLKSSSSLIQVEDSAVNIGDIHMQRSPNFDESAVGNNEYIYWSSPVTNFSVNSISPSSSLMYSWTPTVNGNGIGNHGEWQNASGNMNNGSGYIVNGLGGTPTTIPSTTYPIPNNTALFSGVPNNGIITKQIFHGGYNGGTYAGNGNIATNEDDNWNLIGNPYPSAISAIAFINLNTNINGTIYVWPHNSSYSNINIDPFYENYVYNYDGNDYIEYNNTGSNPPGVNDLFIGAGQSFFVMMNHSATSGTNVTFNNNMRQVLSTYENSTFYRTNSSESDSNRTSIERHRIWLDLISPNNITNSILVGYIQNATNDFDRIYDGYDFKDASNAFYSILENKALSIQGKALPFLQEDLVPLGITIDEIGNHTIAINTLDGLFSNQEQNIYLEDTYNNIIHDIRNSPYTFTVDEVGIYDDRFILRYRDEALGLEEFTSNSDLTIVAPNNNYIKVTSKNETIDSVIIYDLLGHVLIDKKNINAFEFVIDDISFSASAYIVKASLLSGKEKTQKVVIKD